MKKTRLLIEADKAAGRLATGDPSRGDPNYYVETRDCRNCGGSTKFPTNEIVKMPRAPTCAHCGSENIR